MRLPTGLTRAHVAGSFRALLEPAQAAALEHACYCLAESQPTAASYERLALRALEILRGRTRAKLDELGALLFVGAPLETLVGTIPAREEILEREAELRRSAALLRDLGQGDGTDGTDCGAGGLHCKHCNATDITYTLLQTRSADEGSTVFCSCKCGRRWKM